ncbi:hypothetical protein NBRC116592_14970 [Colwellia sp. KU-HH00111]|uniref:hypothetical protein n=1 Tax=Colwellia sp. KU-HH00111 TaxID=3127652 RepID=UPI00310380F0
MNRIKILIQELIILLYVSLLIGCSTTTVHVNTRYLNDIDSQTIKSELKAKGLKVEFNDLVFPENITSTSILYSPFISNKVALSQIENILATSGFHVEDISALVAANHWYTKDTIGLFIVPDGIHPNSGKNSEDIALQYQSEQCDKSIQLNLQKNGKFTYEFSTAQENMKLTGTWSITGYPYILLESEDPYLHYYLEVSRNKAMDKISEIMLVKLTPLTNSPVISNCTFLHGIRI